MMLRERKESEKATGWPLTDELVAIAGYTLQQLSNVVRILWNSQSCAVARRKELPQ